MALLRRKSQRTISELRPMTLSPGQASTLNAFPSPVVASVRQMITQLAYQERLPDRIAVAAALRGEGVTYISLALATTLANDLAARVCVVELNWWSPGLRALWSRNIELGANRDSIDNRTIQISYAPGLAEVLTEKAALDEALIPTPLPNLMLLPAGDLPAWQWPAMARSADLKICIERLREQFDHLVLDIPAILTTSDSIALASLGSACCLVVRQGITQINSVRQALDDVKHLTMLGVVLNQAQIQTPKWIRAFIPQE